MSDLRQFRAMLYAILTLTAIGYGIAIESPAHIVIGVLLVQLNRWLTANGRSFAIPKYLGAAMALATGIWSAMGLVSGEMTPLLAISQWLFFLLLVLLWGKHDNRSHAQILMMTLVLMVAGAINSASLFYGIILIVYIFAALYTCLLFHLKVENEHAAKAYRISPDQLEVGASHLEKRQFHRSMRRLAGLVSFVSLLLAVLVFLLFPRSTSPNLLMRMQPAARSTLTGFSERVSLDQVARITQSQEIVAHVALTRDGAPFRPGDLYLRGTTLDVYTGGATQRRGLRWQWLRGTATWESGHMHHVPAGEGVQIAAAGAEAIYQRILLTSTGTPTLFAMDGPTWLRCDRALGVQYFGRDGTLRAVDMPRTQLEYEVISSGRSPNEPHAPTPPPYQDTYGRSPNEPYSPNAAQYPGSFYRAMSYLPTESTIDPAVAEYARRPEVSGVDGTEPLYRKRGKRDSPSSLDAAIARNIESYLQREFRYTLDLSDTRRGRDEDPIAAFLTDYKRGHCEYFAGAMTLMCQSLGLDARMVIGFRVGAEDYNELGGYFVVRQSHAHAWVEVLTTDGWQRYDPTASQYYTARPHAGSFRGLRDFFDYLQYRWATSVVTYSNESRVDVWNKVESGISGSLTSGADLMTRLKSFLRTDQAYRLSSRLIIFGIAVLLLVLVVAVLAFLLEKRKLYRRAQRIGLSALPAEQQLQLAKQLAFYDDLLQLLARQQLYRRPDMTHREFSRSLSFLPTETYNSICELTDAYYRVRYGRRAFDTAQRRKLSSAINRISGTLSTAKSSASQNIP